ncbi:MAG: peptidoglycan DD-metalloendopeptidase family protein [Aestuariivirga sp.]|nr:peptidoglycan DD-metalloendopeptidase family protein [Aestuariivirga sp.]
MLTACSADMERFASNPSNADPVYTASVPKNVNASNVGVPDTGVSSKPLAGAASRPPSYDYSKSYQAPQYRQPAAPAVAAAGGTVTVGPGMTLYSVARANNLSVAELAAANGIQAPYSVHTGQLLKLPGAAAGAAPRVASQNGIPPDNTSFAEPSTTPIAPKPGTPASTAAAKPFKTGPSVAATSTGEMHTVASGETLFSLGRKFGLSPYAIADANGLPHNAQLALGQKVRIPAGGEAAPAVADAKPAAPSATTAAAGAMPAATGEEGTGQKTAATTAAPAPQPIPGPDQNAAASAPPPAPEAGGQQVAEGAPIAGTPGMRWPVRGKIISGFGPKANGLKNEGINIAVPEGTSIRAAADGVVAYSGNELKGYGNLVLIRHEDGYVTAYAHASELFVKRGDTVKRGDVIAKAGQTGSVSSPQLHFEVRKGAVALDPMKFLSQNTASAN